MMGIKFTVLKRMRLPKKAFTSKNILSLYFFIFFNGVLFILIRRNDKSMPNQNVSSELVLEANSFSPTESLKKKAVIVISSVGRSGSTILAEILKTRENSILFFEPDFFIQNDDCLKVPNCVVEYLRNILYCSYDQQFKNSLVNKYMFFKYFHKSLTECTTTKNKSSQCTQEIDMRGLCTDAEFRIMKVIRINVGYMESLLKDKKLDVKLIYLLRDPRGSGNSYIKFGWDSSPQNICSKLNDDLIAFDYLKLRYPDKVTKITYEEFCLSPVKITEYLFKFAFNDDVLSEETKLYLKNHTTINNDGEMNTQRKSEEHHQKWRLEISEKYLNEIESFKSCKTVLNKVGYKIFQNIGDVRNTNVSAFQMNFWQSNWLLKYIQQYYNISLVDASSN